MRTPVPRGGRLALTEPNAGGAAGRAGVPGWALGVALAGALGLGVALGTVSRPDEPHWPSYAELYADVAPVVVGVSLEAPESRVGSGFAVSSRQVITARHLVVGAEQVRVALIDGRSVTARVVGSDSRTDLALLETEDAVLTPAVLGDAGSLRVGDTVLAIGNPYGLGHSLAVGVVGNLARRLDEGADGPRVGFLQLTIPLNPGNSGGPVFDERGRVVAVLAGTHAQGQAIAFAVPVEALQQTLPALARGEQLSRAFLGVRTEDVQDGVAIVSVIPRGPADRAGLRVGDVIVSIDGDAIGSPEALHAVLDHMAAGTHARIGIDRGGERRVVEVETSDWADVPLVVAGMALRPVAGTGGEVVALRPRSRAELAGVRLGDVVRAIDGLPVQAPAAVQEALVGGGPGQIEVLRAGAPLVLQLPDRE